MFNIFATLSGHNVQLGSSVEQTFSDRAPPQHGTTLQLKKQQISSNQQPDAAA